MLRGSLEPRKLGRTMNRAYEQLEAAKSDARLKGPHGDDFLLFSRFLNGDDHAFMELFDRHTHRIYLYCLKFLGDREQAEDIMQDVWEKVIKLREEGKKAPPNPVGLILTIARNRCLNLIRDRRRLSSLEDVSEHQHPVETIREMSQMEELAVTALAKLPVSQREVLVLHVYSGFRFDEIAEMLGEPVGAIRTRAWRGRLTLGKIISSLLELDGGDENDMKLYEPEGE